MNNELVTAAIVYLYDQWCSGIEVCPSEPILQLIEGVELTPAAVGLIDNRRMLISYDLSLRVWKKEQEKLGTAKFTAWSILTKEFYEWLNTPVGRKVFSESAETAKSRVKENITKEDLTGFIINLSKGIKCQPNVP